MCCQIRHSHQFIIERSVYSKANGRSPAHSDMQTYFKVTPAAVHQMVLTLEEKGFISRVPQQARRIKLLVSRAEIPDLD